MTARLVDYWPVLCPALPPAWDTPRNRRNLAEAAARMAPIPRIALECRLGDDAPRIDVQQCIRRDDGEPGLLRDFLEATQPAARAGGGAWARLYRFCAAWADPATRLHGGIGEIFLEHDLEGDAQAANPPSLFFSVTDAGGADAASEEVVHEALSLLLPESRPAALAGNLDRCFAACPPGAFVAYVGAMLGRAAQAVRVNVKRLPLDELAPFLDRAGWTGSRRVVERWAAWAYDRLDRVTVCLDVGPVVYPHVALECALALQPAHEPRWHALLDELVGAGLCAAANAPAFLTLPGVVCPTATDVDWPAPWMAATLRAPPDHFSTAERQLSHVKLTVMDEQVLLKGYWGAGHIWRVARPRREPVRPPRGRAAGEALSRAAGFLLSRQAHTGRWSDFLLPAGPSDEWVTAFVAACLLEAPGNVTGAAAGRAWDALVRRRPDEPGWGYNRLTPTDADSTAWALRLAAGLGLARSGRAAAARHFLAGHRTPDGGLMTYGERDPIRRYTRLPDDASLAGWQAAHACVTAAAAPVVGATVLEYLRNRQGPSGSWQGYWWWDDEYTTALAAEALPAASAPAVAWAQSRVSAAGAVHSGDGRPSPWATAWCVRALCLGSTAEARQARARAVQWLVDTQEEDGSWPASARLRVPLPADADAAGPERKINALDHNRVFTTAAVMAALARCAGGKR